MTVQSRSCTAIITTLVLVVRSEPKLQNGYELLLMDVDVCFVEYLLSKIRSEYEQPGEWR